MKTRGAAKKAYNISDKSQWSELEALSVQNGGRGEESDGEGLLEKGLSHSKEVVRLFSPLQCRAIIATPDVEKTGVQSSTYKICTKIGSDGSKCGSSGCSERMFYHRVCTGASRRSRAAWCHSRRWIGNQNYFHTL